MIKIKYTTGHGYREIEIWGYNLEKWMNNMCTYNRYFEFEIIQGGVV